jgi:hypothetical protein
MRGPSFAWPTHLDVVLALHPQYFGSDLSEPKYQVFVLTRFLHANRYPLRSKTL